MTVTLRLLAAPGPNIERRPGDFAIRRKVIRSSHADGKRPADAFFGHKFGTGQG
jgi:hypothetical protein